MGNGENGIEVIPTDESAIAALTRGEVDIQIVTAHRFHRSIKRSLDNLRTQALLNERTAESCLYTLKRGGKHIEGPSIRMAEMAAGSWGNLRIEGRILEPGRKTATAQATCWDLETNVAIRIEVSRRITDKQGNRYNDDMINLTQNAALSVAVRNSIFRIIPRAFIDQILSECKQLAFGDAQSIAEKRTRTVKWFGGIGVTEEQVLAYLDKPSFLDIDAGDLGKLAGAMNRIKDGAAEIEDVFPEVRPDKPPATSKVAEKIKERKRANGKTKPGADKPPAPVGVTEAMPTVAAPPDPAPSSAFEKLTATAMAAGIAPAEWGDWKNALAISDDKRTHRGKQFTDSLAKLAKWIDDWKDSQDAPPDDQSPADTVPLDPEGFDHRRRQVAQRLSDEPRASKETIAELFSAVEARFGSDAKTDILRETRTILGFPDHIGAIDDLTESEAQTVIEKCRTDRNGQGRLM